MCQGITFSEFKDFCQFLNNLDDFALAMRIYTYANQPISEGRSYYSLQPVSQHVIIDYYYRLTLLDSRYSQ